MLLRLFLLVCCSFSMVYAQNETLNQNFTKIEHVSNVYVGSKYFQKINEFFIAENRLSCMDRFLPIIFDMLNERKEKLLVNGLLTEFGYLVSNQENNTNCKLIKKYRINDETSVIIFDSKPIVVPTSHIRNVISSNLYEKHFLLWIFFTLQCYDLEHGRVLVSRVVKEVSFYLQITAIVLYIALRLLRFCKKHYKYYLLLQEMLAKIDDIESESDKKSKKKKR